MTTMIRCQQPHKPYLYTNVHTFIVYVNLNSTEIRVNIEICTNFPADFHSLDCCMKNENRKNSGKNLFTIFIRKNHHIPKKILLYIHTVRMMVRYEC